MGSAIAKQGKGETDMAINNSGCVRRSEGKAVVLFDGYAVKNDSGDIVVTKNIGPDQVYLGKSGCTVELRLTQAEIAALVTLTK